MAYASALLRDPAQTYRRIDLAGRTANADGPALVQLLYDELCQALRVAAWAAENRKFAVKSERVTRATAIGASTIAACCSRLCTDTWAIRPVLCATRW